MRERRGWTGRLSRLIRSKARPVGAAMCVVVVAAMAAGCREQQLEETNAALQRQLQETLIQNAELQRELDQVRAAPPAPAEPAEPSAPVESRPKPDFGPDVEVRTSGDTMTVTLPDKVLFTSGSADLKGPAKAVLDKVARVLNSDYASHMIRVEGHTDNQPIRRTKKLWQDNWDLSCNRAMAVARYLVSKGIDPKRTYAAGFAYHQPVASNATAAGRSRNRRVEIVVAPR
ncbi:MAG: OmpA family protein [Phycisphaerae bacterium]